MDWTTGEGYSIPIGTHYHMSDPKEVSSVSFTLHLSPFTRKQLYRHLQQAYACGALRVVKRIHVLLALAEEMSVQEVAAMVGLGEQTVRDCRNCFLLRRMASLTYKRPPGRPRKLTKVQRRARRIDQSWPPSCGLSEAVAEYADDSRPHPESFWRVVSSALSCDLAAQFGLFLSEGTLCLRSPQ